MSILARVAINLPLDQTFYYIVPKDMKIPLFSRVKINFNGRNLMGFVVAFINSQEVSEELKNIELKQILSVIDKEPIIDSRIIDIAQWMSDYYIVPFGEALHGITPSARRTTSVSHTYTYSGELATLTPLQKETFQTILSSLGKPKTFLIYGITGSGKTEIYKHLVYEVLQRGGSAIILIPEISLTPQTLQRFYESFGNTIAVYHSKLNPRERLSEWQRAMRGQARIMIGPRSAIFAPVQKLMLIIIDEEHENSYKSSKSPRYHARQIAFYRARQESATLVLGSATPQLETYYHALNGTIKLLKLNERYRKTSMPSVTVADMKRETEGNSHISSILFKKMLATIENNKQVLIFINRRGYSPVLFCEACGFTFGCPNCDVTLTYHRKQHSLICHHCGYTSSIPTVCPSCGNPKLKEMGIGTERLESDLSNMFPSTHIVRMDLDTTRKKLNLNNILNDVREGKAHILIGTQMVAKGHDMPGIHLVGAILPDIMLNLPDFRSAERTFTMLTQVIGRAGRRKIPGEAVIQTYLPQHYAIQAAAMHDYLQFYNQEITKRKQFDYPPFTRLGRLVFRSKNRAQLEKFIDNLKFFIKELQTNFNFAKILGPVTCPIEKLNNNYRYHIIIKSDHSKTINNIARRIRDFFQQEKKNMPIYMEIDIDPVNLM